MSDYMLTNLLGTAGATIGGPVFPRFVSLIAPAVVLVLL